MDAEVIVVDFNNDTLAEDAVEVLASRTFLNVHCAAGCTRAARVEYALKRPETKHPKTCRCLFDPRVRLCTRDRPRANKPKQTAWPCSIQTIFGPVSRGRTLRLSS